MKQIINTSTFDVIFLSYDEPCADENFKRAQSFIPWIQRVHGVKGSDTAHKACANLARTDRVIIIDGDNMLHTDELLDHTIEVDTDYIDINTSVISWPSINSINGLLYGNGGIKCWPTQVLVNMKTHELADPANHRSQVDFCWDINYVAVDKCFSSIVNNATPYQAWRAGFREGVKMSLNEGTRDKDFSNLWEGNINRLLVWMTVGADVDNGLWAILGARQGCWMTMCTDWDYVSVRDFDKLQSIWDTSNFNVSNMQEKIEFYAVALKNIISIAEPFSLDQSKFFKKFNYNQPRQHPAIRIL